MRKDIIRNSRILVVDDQPANVLLMDRILKQSGYEHFTSVTDPRRAIETFRVFAPDLIVLDLMMPNVDGFALLTQLRGWIPDGVYLPVLVITADVTRSAREKALSLGAKDFLTKPIDTTEAGLRIYNLLQTRWLYRELQTQNAVLEKTVQARTQDLAEANRRLSILDETKTEFLNLISHELRTPLNGLLGFGDLLMEELGGRPDCIELREMFDVSRSRILGILDNALLLTEVKAAGESFAVAPVCWTTTLDRALRKTVALASSRGVVLEPAPAGLGLVRAHEGLLVKALGALLETAAKIAAPGDRIALTATDSTDGRDLRMRRRAAGCPPTACPSSLMRFR